MCVVGREELEVCKFYFLLFSLEPVEDLFIIHSVLFPTFDFLYLISLYLYLSFCKEW
jgi:hypothetical protein